VDQALMQGSACPWKLPGFLEAVPSKFERKGSGLDPRVLKGAFIQIRPLSRLKGSETQVRHQAAPVAGHVRQHGVTPQRHPDHQLAATSSPLTSSTASPSITSRRAFASDSALI